VGHFTVFQGTVAGGARDVDDDAAGDGDDDRLTLLYWLFGERKMSPSSTFALAIITHSSSSVQVGAIEHSVMKALTTQQTIPTRENERRYKQKKDAPDGGGESLSEGGVTSTLAAKSTRGKINFPSRTCCSNNVAQEFQPHDIQGND
jgi:hypothetical protein